VAAALTAVDRLPALVADILGGATPAPSAAAVAPVASTSRLTTALSRSDAAHVPATRLSRKQSKTSALQMCASSASVHPQPDVTPLT
jgi:hypothetical protein